MTQELKQRQHVKRETEDAKVEPVTDAEAKAKRDADFDAILDEIDGVLEENAQEFVSSYIQVGGE